jgi:glycerophosphoryl diester phosphodiesterase
MVIAHRGNWREAPENSIWAIKKAYEAGANMAEIDLAMTKDSVLILLHDKTLDRTTTGKGKPSDYLYKDIQKLRLRAGTGVPTRMTIPTLEEALITAKGKIFLNLDKGFEYFDKVLPLLKKYNMLDEVLLKANVDYATFNKRYGDIKDQMIFMPIIHLASDNGPAMIEAYLKNGVPYGFEFTVGSDESHLIDFSPLRKKGIKVWVNSLWPEQNAGHDDDAALENPHVYDWFVAHQINMVQTDRIKELTDYLKSKGLWMPNP